MKIRVLIAIATLMVLGACANPGIVPISDDTYLLSRTDKAGIFGNPSAMKADVMREAEEFAASKGKVAVTVSIRETPLIVGQRFASIDYQFILVDKDDPRAKHGTLVRGPDVLIEKKESNSTETKTQDLTNQKHDLYTDLIKLDDLHKRGILTDTEFAEQKKKILEAQ